MKKTDRLPLITPKSLMYKGLHLSCLVSAPKNKRKIWPLFHVNRWRSKCFELHQLHLQGQPYLKAFDDYYALRMKCFPVGYRYLVNTNRKKVRVLEADKPPVFCRRFWICPWCSTRAAVSPLISVYRRVLPVLESQAEFEWHRFNAWYLLSDDISSVTPDQLKAFHDRFSEIRVRLGRSCRESVKGLALASRVRYCPVYTAVAPDKPVGLAAHVRVVSLTKPSPATGRVPDLLRRLGADAEVTTHSAPADCWQQTIAFLSWYPRSLLYATGDQLWHLERLRQECGRMVTVTAVAGDKVIRLASSGSTPKTDGTDPPPEPA